MLLLVVLSSFRFFLYEYMLVLVRVENRFKILDPRYLNCDGAEAEARGNILFYMVASTVCEALRLAAASPQLCDYY